MLSFVPLCAAGSKFALLFYILLRVALPCFRPLAGATSRCVMICYGLLYVFFVLLRCITIHGLISMLTVAAIRMNHPQSEKAVELRFQLFAFRIQLYVHRSISHPLILQPFVHRLPLRLKLLFLLARVHQAKDQNSLPRTKESIERCHLLQQLPSVGQLDGCMVT